MHCVRLRAATSSLLPLPLLFVAAANVAAAKGLAQTSPPANAAATALPVDATAGLPGWLLPVPGGQVWVGVPADKLLEICSQAVNPVQPERADPKLITIKVGQTASELGRVKLPVDTFLLARTPVTNKEYRRFVEKLKVRYPFHWWHEGRKDDYELKLEDIKKQYPASGKMAGIDYFNHNWAELPYELKDDKGKPIDDLPVTNVSWREAVRYAGWLGMRLPTEVELTRAMRGDGDNYYLWSGQKELGDKYTPAVMPYLHLKNLKDQVLKAVGKIDALKGPYGHYDLIGQVWQLTSDLGFMQLAGKKEFEAEWKKLMNDKVGKVVAKSPTFWDARVVMKGGWYFSSGDPVQLHIDARMGVETTEALESVGFRLAKSLRPGYDMLFSLSKDYNTQVLGGDQKPNFSPKDAAMQVGIERYVLDADSNVDEYHALSLVPMNFMVKDKGELSKLIDESQLHPLPIATFATTEKLIEPDLAAGIYTLVYRQKGMPKELTDAIKAGHKDVQAAIKRKERGEEDKPDDKKDKGKADWRSVLAKYGLTEKDLEPKDAVEKLNFVRVDGGFTVPTDENTVLFFGNDGKYLAALPVRSEGLVGAAVGNSQLELGSKDVQGEKHQAVDFKFAIPLDQKNQKRGADLKLTVVLEAAPQPKEAPWRLPVEIKPAPGAASKNANSATPGVTGGATREQLR